MKKKYIISGILIAVVGTIILLGTQTEVLQGRLRWIPPKNIIPTQRSFNVTNISFGDTLIPYYMTSPTGQKLNIRLSMKYIGRGSLRFGTDYNWKLRCHNSAISGFNSVLVDFPTNGNNVLTSGSTVTSQGELILSAAQLTKLKAGDGNIFCGFSNDKPDDDSHNNVSYGYANKRIKTSYQVHINDDNTVDVR